jgi:hypothetical protein
MAKRRVPRAGTLIAAFALIVTLVVAGTASAKFGENEGSKAAGKVSQASSNYIVQMVGDPAVAYTGGVAGLKATKPAKGQKIDPEDADVVKYYGYLKDKHDSALAAVGGSNKLYDYAYVFNGFAATLSKEQAQKLQAQPDVISVEKQQTVEAATATTPGFLGLSANGGLWEQLGGVGKAGEDIVVGDLDTGIWPEDPSFSDRTGPNNNAVTYQNIPHWHGQCHPGENWTAADCNQKVIGARWYAAGYGVDRIIPEEFASPRDFDGHGSHTASTAAGNNGVPATGIAAALGNMSGMAPRARISVYKVLWESADHANASGTSTDIVAAIDQAVADGVDVINYSISGTLTSFLDSVEVAFLFAEDAGVFVSASAGNSGPTPQTVAHPSPWLTTVAAGTHNRGGDGSVTLGDGTTIHGASLTPGVGPAPFVLATASGVAGADPNLLRQCFSDDGSGHPVLDPAKVTGKIVLCERGGAAPNNARVDKSAAVKNAGGVGVVIANVAVNSLNADLHVIPAVHVANTALPVLNAYGATAGATATIAQGVVNTSVPAPLIAAFSSRGPSRASIDQLKPDITAPGQDILAAVSPANGGLTTNLLSGTSMSAPHITGIAALMKQLHPNWSPMAIKSALMTSAGDLLTATSPFNQGAGHVRPNAAADPGLVYDSSFWDFIGFICGTGQLSGSICTGPGAPIDPSDLNLASITIGDLAGQQTITRTVKNVGSSSATYNANVVAPSGITVAVNPASFTIAPGATRSYTVTFTRTTATLNAYVFGSLTWSDGTHSVRSPLTIRPVAIAAPSAVAGTGTSGSTSYGIKTGYAGPLAYAIRGLIPATTIAGHVVDDPTDNFVKDGPGTTKHDISIPAGTTLARFSLFDDAVDGNDDLDLYVYNPSGDLVGSSGGGTAQEEVNLTNPAAGTYSVYVHGFATDGPDSNYTLFSWALGSSPASPVNLTATGPTTATIGGTGTVTLDWSGLTAGNRYLGAVDYTNGASTIGTTIVRVNG